jgi:hypothetical protein
MADPIAGEIGTSKRAIVADALNRLLTELILRCLNGEEGMRDYFHVAVIGYGDGRATSALGGILLGKNLVPIGQIADHPLRVEQRVRKEPDGAGGVIELKVDFPIWVEPIAKGNTPMRQALSTARDLVHEWVSQHPNSYPPITLNLTDGEGNDGDPIPPADELRSLTTEDGNSLLFNLHVSSTSLAPISFPDTDIGLSDAYARTLFGMSSVLPPKVRSYAAKAGYNIREKNRGFVYNADIVSIVQFLDIGTRVDVALR